MKILHFKAFATASVLAMETGIVLLSCEHVRGLFLEFAYTGYYHA